MTLQQFREAFQLAKDTSVSLDYDCLSIFDGFGLRDFQPITATVQSVAALIRWQSMYVGTKKGTVGPQFDNDSLDEIRQIGKRKFVIAG